MINKKDETYLKIAELIDAACIDGYHYCKYLFDAANIPDDALDTLLDDGYVVSFTTDVDEPHNTYILVEW